MDRQKDTTVEALLEQLIEHGPNDIATVFVRAFELAMQTERERFLGAGHYERTAERQGYANGYKSKGIDTPAGTVTVGVPKTACHDGTPFYPQSLECGRRSVRAVMLAVAEMYIKGVSTREAEAVMREFGIDSLSSSQVSRAARLLAKAETALAELVAPYQDTATKLAAWLEENVPEGLAVFSLPEHHRRRMRTSNPMERGVQQELKRRTVKARVFPNEDSLERLVSAVLVEIDDKWAADTKAYIEWECQDA